MDPQTAFRRLHNSEGNAGRAARILGYALVAQHNAWAALSVKPQMRRMVENALQRAELEPTEIDFCLGDAAEQVTTEQLKNWQKEIERDFATLACNTFGHLYKKTEWRDRRNREDESELE